MNRVINIVAVLLITALMGFTGYAVIAMQATGNHSSMIQHGSVDCVSYCLSQAPIGYMLPVIAQIGRILGAAGDLIVAVVLSALLAASFTIYAARPRPSPNLIALHSNYLE